MIDVAVVGAGVAGLLVARELVAAGKEVLVLERGADKSHAAQLADQLHALAGLSTAEHNDSPVPDGPGEDWDYEYGVGGSGLHWGGITPRFLPSDFELRSRYGVGRDWPFSYDEISPWYQRAERALAVAGAPIERFGPTHRPPYPAHPFSEVDTLLAPLLAPYHPLSQARPTASVNGRPACCGSGRCGLCPVDSRFSPLHLLDDGLRDAEGFELRARVVVTRVVRDDRRWRLELVGEDGARSTVEAPTVVIAANGIESPALLLRSELGGADTGRWLNDHEHLQLEFEVDRDAGAGEGASINTGISYAWAEGEWRRERGSQIVYPDNRGAYIGRQLIDALVDGRRGRALRRDVTRRFQRTLVLDAIGEDVPQDGRRVELASKRDAFGIPRNRVRYPGDSPYLERSRAVLQEDLLARLRPLHGTLRATRRYRGGHMLGTCRMGRRDGVVDADLAVRGVQGLYVVGGSVFPSYSAAHPTLTIAALALRLGGLLSRA